MGFEQFPTDLSVNGHHVDWLFWYATYLVIGTFMLILAILAYCAVRYRSRPGHRAIYVKGDTKRSTILTLAFGALVFVGLDINLAYFDFIAYDHVYGNPPTEADNPLQIDVRGQQYQWNFRYPGPDGVFGATSYEYVETDGNFFGLDPDDEAGQDDQFSIAEVAFPQDRRVVFKITSNDVLHSFFLPHYRVKMDALPGTETWLYIDSREFEPGETEMRGEVACAELCGMNHYKMRADLIVMTTEDYEAWLEEIPPFYEEEDY